MPFNSHEFYEIIDSIADILDSVVSDLVASPKTAMKIRKLVQRLDQMEVQVSASVQSESVGPDSAANPI
jgi:hypothetical protein